MALKQVRNWLIAYDIASPRRLRRVHRFLCRHAIPVQYSVFVARCSPAKLGVIRSALAELVKRREDDVRFYPVPEPAQLFVYGRKALPEGLLLLDGAASLPLAPPQAPLPHVPPGKQAGQGLRFADPAVTGRESDA
jgi:CRISPR-associated protein Cas2